MAKDNKFGTFGGVFTPSILTILGVIMYLRLPWVVGQSGLVQTLGIILVAHLVSWVTGLSISSIATDKSVGAGGPYYIVSRSLGLPIGGTLGLALFVGLSFSISLYVIGFSESFLPTVGLVEPGEAIPLDLIRICGTAVLVTLTIITFISTSLAIKMQYVILGAIVLSLGAIFLGNPPETMAVSELQLWPREGSVGLTELFAVFFPAVTGFTAGVNMSGDLRDPKKSIPGGTMAAIVTGFVVYVCLAIFLALRVSPEALSTNTKLLEDIAVHPWPVIGGIWGATLSSALGSILGAPRILQAVSSDGITPRFFAKGTGKTNEPRNALFLAFVLGEAGILIAELDAIAAIVSMVFLATYGFLNLSCFIESWANPDFRPEFKVRKIWSLLGAVACVLLMIQLDIAAMIASTLLLGGLFLYLERGQLRLESGDTWEGIWASVVRAGLHRLGRGSRQQRQWRPNVLMFTQHESGARQPLLSFASSLISGRGMVTEFVLTPMGARKRIERNQSQEAREELPMGVFSRVLPSETMHESVLAACRFHGFSGLEPNTVLLDWSTHEHDLERFPELLDELAELDLNTLVFSRQEGAAPQQKGQRSIDVWWTPEEGNFALGLSLLRFVTSSEGWDDAKLRVLLVSNDRERNDDLRRSAAGLLKDARITASLEVFHDVKTLESLIAKESADADLTIAGIPANETPEQTTARMSYLATRLARVLFVEAAESLLDSLHLASPKSAASLSLEGAYLQMADLDPPDHPLLGEVAEDFDEGYHALVSDFNEQGVARLYGLNLDLVASVQDCMGRHFVMLQKGLKTTSPAKRRSLVNRVQSSFLIACGELFSDHSENLVREQVSVLAGAIDLFMANDYVAESKLAPLRVSMDREAFALVPGDPDHLRSFKRRRRWLAWFRREDPYYFVPLAKLQDYYSEQAVIEILRRTLLTFFSDSHQLMVQIARTVTASETSLAVLGGEDETDFADFVQEREDGAKTHFDEIEAQERGRVEALHKELEVAAHELSQGFSDDLKRLGIRRWALKQRERTNSATELRTELESAATRWAEMQELLVGRARAGLQLSAVQHRLATVAQRLKQTLALEVRNGTLAEYERLREALRESLEQVKSREAFGLAGSYEFSNRFDARPVIDGLVRQSGTWLSELPESFETLTPESMAHLSEGKHLDRELTSVAVRRRVQQLIETEFIAPLAESLTRIPELERHATGVAQDVVRLVRFGFAEAEVLDGQQGEAAEAGHGEMISALEDALERVEEELERLQAFLPFIAESIDSHLASAVRGMDLYELSSAETGINLDLQKQQDRALGWARGSMAKVRERVRDASVSLLYRRSEGILLAERLRDRGDPTTVAERILAFSQRNSPKAEVLKDLPFYYRQLFFRQSLVNESFWVGREHTLNDARHAIAAHRHGTPGTLIVRGEPDSGKSALTRKILSGPLAKQRVIRVGPPPPGPPTRRAFRRAIRLAVEQGNSTLGAPAKVLDTGTVLEGLPFGSVILIEDLELWWERREGGWEVVDELLALVRKAAGRCLFLIEISTHAFAFISRFRPLADTAITVLESGPLPAESLKKIVMLRHGSTGLKFDVGSKTQDELAPWDYARLFSAHFDYSHGQVGATLRAWVSCISKVEERRLHIRAPESIDWEVLDELRVEWTAILLQLLLHKRADAARLRRITGLGQGELNETLTALARTGLIVDEGRGVFEINPFSSHLLLRSFEQRGLLP